MSVGDGQGSTGTLARILLDCQTARDPTDWGSRPLTPYPRGRAQRQAQYQIGEIIVAVVTVPDAGVLSSPTVFVLDAMYRSSTEMCFCTHVRKCSPARL